MNSTLKLIIYLLMLSVSFIISGKATKAPDSGLIDLHCHLDGSITVDIAKKLAALQNIEIEKDDEKLLDLISVPETCQSLNEFLEKFDFPLRLLQTVEGITEAVYLVQENAKSQGVIYLEIRFAPQLHCDKGLTQEEVVKAALKGLEKSDLHTNLILCMMRGDYNDENKKKNEETLRLAKEYLQTDNGVVGVDIAGAEGLFKTKNYINEFKYARENNIPITIHAGEADDYTSVQDSIDFGAVRIGHGIRSEGSEELLKNLTLRKTVLEMAPSSNRLTHAVENMKEYPLKKFLNQGLKVTLNTDDFAICRTTIKQEFQYVIDNYDLSEEDITTIMLNSADGAFCSEETKRELKKKIIQLRYNDTYDPYYPSYPSYPTYYNNTYCYDDGKDHMALGWKLTPIILELNLSIFLEKK